MDDFMEEMDRFDERHAELTLVLGHEPSVAEVRRTRPTAAL